MEQLNEYLERLASKKSIPGGGGASAICGAIGAALGEMVGNLTTGKKKYADLEPEIRENIDNLSKLRRRFLELSDEDELAFEPLSKAYGMKAETDEEKAAKDEYMEKCLDAAAAVPMETMETCIEAMGSLEFFAENGSRLAVSDAGVGIQMVRAALLGAVLNVYCNTKLMKDRERAAEINERADSLAEEGTRLADGIYAIVMEALKV